MRDLQIPGDGSVIENKTFMENTADEIVEGYEYTRTLSEEEIQAEKDEFAAVSIKIEQIEEEKARVMLEINERLKAEKAKAKKALGLVRRGRIDVIETVYLVKDEVEGKVGTYTMNGNIIAERRMTGTERQKSIYTRDKVEYKDGTNG